MADPKELDEALNKTDVLSENVAKLSETQNTLINTVLRLSDSFKITGKTSIDLSENLSKLKNEALYLGEIGKEAATKISSFFSKIDVSQAREKINSVGKELIGVGLGAAQLASPFNDSGAGVKFLTDNLSKFNTIGPIITGIISKFDGALRELKQTQYVAAEAIMVSGKSLEDNRKIINEYPQALRMMSAETGSSGKDINEFNKIVGRSMPDALRLVNKDLIGIKDGLGEVVQPSIVAMTAFKALGIDAATAGKKTLDASFNFGQTALQTAQNLGIMAKAAENTGIDTQTAQEQITKASSSLAIFGRQTSESAAVWRTFAETLKAGGVPITEAGNIIDGITKSIAGMSSENRAFIGMMSGITKGSSALGGALKLELAMRQEGGMQKNLEALTGAVSKITGSRILTLDEAAKNPQLEMQFQMQRQLLQKLGVSGDDNQRARVLEVMQKIQSGGITAIDADKAMNDIYKKGKDLQQESLTIQDKMYQALRAILAAQTGSDAALRKLDKGIEAGIKTKKEGGEIRLNDSDSTFLSEIRKMALTNPEEKRRKENRISMVFGKENIPGERALPGLLTPRKAIELPERATLKAVTPTASAVPTRPSLKSRAPDTTIPALTNISNTVSRGDAQTHRDLQQLLEATRTGLAPLRETKTPSTSGTKPVAESSEIGGTSSTLVIKIEGGAKNIIEEIKKAIEEKFNKNTLGIYGD